MSTFRLHQDDGQGFLSDEDSNEGVEMLADLWNHKEDEE